MQILNTIATQDCGACLKDLARRVGLPSSTTHRLLTTLESERYVTFDNKTLHWSIGPEAVKVANSFQEDGGETVSTDTIDAR